MLLEAAATWSFTDTGQTPGTTHTYKVRAKDAVGNIQWTLATNAVTVSARSPVGLRQPGPRRRRAAPVASRERRRPRPSTPSVPPTSSSPARQPPPASDGGGGLGSTGGTASKGYTTFAEPKPDAVTLEAWVKTTSGNGGRIIGLGRLRRQLEHVLRPRPLPRQQRPGEPRGRQRGQRAGHHDLEPGRQRRPVAPRRRRRRRRRQQPLRRRPRGRAATRPAPRARATAATGGSAATTRPAGRPPDRPDVRPAPSTRSRSTRRALPLSQVQTHYADSGRTADRARRAGRHLRRRRVRREPRTCTGASTSPAGSASPTPRPTAPTARTTGVTATGGPVRRPSPDRPRTFNGTNGYRRDQQSCAATRSPYSEEAWFKTTTTRGGRIIGFGNAASGTQRTTTGRSTCRTPASCVFGVNVGSR